MMPASSSTPYTMTTSRASEASRSPAGREPSRRGYHAASPISRYPAIQPRSSRLPNSKDCSAVSTAKARSDIVYITNPAAIRPNWRRSAGLLRRKSSSATVVSSRSRAGMASVVQLIAAGWPAARIRS